MIIAKIPYIDAFRLNSIIFENYISYIEDQNKFVEYLYYMENLADLNSIIFPKEYVNLLSILKDEIYFLNNFAASMSIIYKILSYIIDNSKYLNFLNIDTLYKTGAILFYKGFEDGTYAYIDILNKLETDIICVVIDDMIIKSSNDKKISQEDRDFVKSIINKGE